MLTDSGLALIDDKAEVRDKESRSFGRSSAGVQVSSVQSRRKFQQLQMHNLVKQLVSTGKSRKIAMWILAELTRVTGVK